MDGKEAVGGATGTGSGALGASGAGWATGGAPAGSGLVPAAVAGGWDAGIGTCLGAVVQAAKDASNTQPMACAQSRLSPLFGRRFESFKFMRPFLRPTALQRSPWLSGIDA